ncbi:MAG: alpha/beta hydrolase [Oscillospiraceae bacterium]|nr:alpha/beta hydrolase [Clostridia bacterium]MBR0341718.1 alpha/beta hydrolase [Oscillospiraceae bacterium]
MKEKSTSAVICEQIAKQTPIPKGKNIQEVIMRFRKYRGNKNKYDLPIFMKIRDNVEGITSHDLQLFYMNVESSSNKLIIYLHGGSYIDELLPFHWLMLNKMTDCIDSAFIIPDYPLAPHATFLECYDKLTAFYRKVLQYYQDKEIILMGDSAGGGLALGLAQYWLTINLKVPDKLILLSPWVDLEMNNPDIKGFIKVDPTLNLGSLAVTARYWAGNYPLSDYRLSPINGDLKVLKDVTLFVGTHEIFYPDVTKLHDLLEKNGVKSRLFIGQGLNHVYPAFPIPEANEAIEEIRKIIFE